MFPHRQVFAAGGRVQDHLPVDKLRLLVVAEVLVKPPAARGLLANPQLQGVYDLGQKRRVQQRLDRGFNGGAHTSYRRRKPVSRQDEANAREGSVTALACGSRGSEPFAG